MKTFCYCIGCKKHPKHNDRKNLKWVTGFPKSIYGEEEKSGADVDCLDPISGFFDDNRGEPEEFEFSETAYGDGDTRTMAEEIGFTIYANCGNEDHED